MRTTKRGALTPKTQTLRKRDFTSPDGVRKFAHGRIDVLVLGDTTIGRAVFEPGWRWSTSVKPIALTETCETRHLGYMVSGRMRVRMTDGTELEARAGDLLEIAPGHDAWVVGEERVEFIELAGAAT